MKKKTKIIIISVLAAIVIALIGYKLIGGAIISSKTREYLKTKECFSKHINSVKVRNSLFNKFMSYDEWNITVNLYGSHEFTFTYRDKKIVLNGLVEDNKLLNSKEHYQALMQKLESGEFCNPTEHQFIGTIVEINSNGSFILEPDINESIRNSADRISVTGKITDDEWEIGMKILVKYSGDIIETHPAQVNVISMERI